MMPATSSSIFLRRRRKRPRSQTMISTRWFRAGMESGISFTNGDGLVVFGSSKRLQWPAVLWCFVARSHCTGIDSYAALLKSPSRFLDWFDLRHLTLAITTISNVGAYLSCSSVPDHARRQIHEIRYSHCLLWWQTTTLSRWKLTTQDARKRSSSKSRLQLRYISKIPGSSVTYVRHKQPSTCEALVIPQAGFHSGRQE